MTAVPIRPATRDDLPGLRRVIDGVALFPSNMLDGMIAANLDGSAGTGEFWLTADGDAGPVAIGYCAPERMTEGTWNMLLIAVDPARQGEGIGAAIMGETERRLTKAGHRILLVETSGLPEFEATRAFYRGLGYYEEARIRDFYQAGEDKVVFRKALGGGA